MASSFPRRATLPAAALIVASALAVSSADGQTGRTLEFTSSVNDRHEFKQIDVRPRGQSIGDHFVVAGTLRAGDGIAGRGHAICTVIDRSYKGQDCQFVLVFRDGTVTASGGGINRLLPGQPPSPPRAPDVFAVTGGTGAYRGASGTLSLQQHEDDSTTVTLSL